MNFSIYVTIAALAIGLYGMYASPKGSLVRKLNVAIFAGNTCILIVRVGSML